MNEQRSRSLVHLTVREDQGLIGVVTMADGKQATEFWADDNGTDRAPVESDTQTALRAIGAWADLDWDAAVDELDEIRNQRTRLAPSLDL